MPRADSAIPTARSGASASASLGQRFAPAQEATFQCADGYRLRGHSWRTQREARHATVIINPATGVAARYYGYFADFLCRHGFDVLTYDYRGVGLSRPASLARASITWRDWGELDFGAVLRSATDASDGSPIHVVGHSIGGFLPGFACNAPRIGRMLTVGAQYAFWWDYAPRRRLEMLLKWHVAMPALTAAFGYFPGRQLGWLEDLPAGVAFEWAFRRRRMEASYPSEHREDILSRFARVRAPILAVGLTDDEFGTPSAIARGLSYYTGSRRIQIMLNPLDLGQRRIGHFDLFHARHASGFWLDTLLWLRDGRNPWPTQQVK